MEVSLKSDKRIFRNSFTRQVRDYTEKWSGMWTMYSTSVTSTGTIITVKKQKTNVLTFVIPVFPLDWKTLKSHSTPGKPAKILEICDFW